jgi:hypothetical protein
LSQPTGCPRRHPRGAVTTGRLTTTPSRLLIDGAGAAQVVLKASLRVTGSWRPLLCLYRDTLSADERTDVWASWLKGMAAR